MKVRLPVVIGFCSLVSILCFAIFGYSGTDYTYHLSSWMYYAEAWKNGIFYPAWAARANFGLGEPRFYYYPPISFWFGSFLSLILPLKIVPSAYVWLTFCLAGFSMHRLSSLFLGDEDRLKAAALYCLSFFLLITASKHFALAELLTDAFLPLICYYFVKLLQSQPRTFPGLTIGLALAIQTDVPAAVDIAYTLGIGAFLFSLQTKKIRPVFLFLGAQTLALLLSAWYLLPAFLAKRQIGSTSLLAYDFRYLFAHTPSAFLDESLSALALISVLILLFCLFRFRQTSEQTTGLQLLIFLGLIAFFFQLPFVRPLWDHLPELRIVGFPFRFQVFLAIALPLAVLSFKPGKHLRMFTFALYGLFAFLPLLSYWTWVRAHGPFPPIRQYAASLADASQGMPEYAPAGTGAIYLRTIEQSPKVSLVSSPGTGCTATIKSWLSENRQIDTAAQVPCTYQLRLYYFPFWMLSLDGKPAAAFPNRQGLLCFAVPAGEHHVVLQFKRPWKPLLTGSAIAGLTLLLLLWFFMQEGIAANRTQP